MSTIRKLVSLIEDMHVRIVQITRELEGWKFATKEKKVRGRYVTYDESIPPTAPPRLKRSDLLDELVVFHFPNLRDEVERMAGAKGVAANVLFLAWDYAIKNGPRRGSVEAFGTLFELVQPFLEMFYPNRNSLATSATRWRTPIKEKYGEKSEIYTQSVWILGITREESIKMKEDYKEATRRAVRDRGDPKFTMEEVYNAIDVTSNTDNPVDNIIAVMLAVGSRMIEVIKISEYTAMDDGRIKIYKLAKMRGANDDETVEGVLNVTVYRPVLRISAEKVVELVKNIRKMHNFKRMKNKEATGKVNGNVNKLMKTLFKIPITGHKSRYLWGSLAWELYGNGVPQAEWVREMYHHSSADTTLTYLKFQVETPKFKVPEELRARVGGLEVDTENLKTEQKSLKDEVKTIEKELNTQIANANMVDLQFPQYANPKRLRLSTDAKLERIRKLDKALADIGIHAIQKTFKKYGWGSSIVQEYYKIRPESFD